MAERAPVSAEETLVRYDNPVLVTKQPEKPVSVTIFLKIICLFLSFHYTNYIIAYIKGL